MRIFVSCVTREFGSYRADLRAALTAAEIEVKVQEDFQDGEGTLLQKLDGYIRGCNAVIHLIGDGLGACAKPAEVRWLLATYPQFPADLADLAPDLSPDTCPFSYTQWEYVLARLHRVPCYTYLAGDGSRREPGWSARPEEVAAQRAYIERLKATGKDRRLEPFDDAREIANRFWKSYFSDRVQSTARVPERAAFVWPQVPEERCYPLADRDREFQLFAALVSGTSAERVLLLHGPSDRGKSVLLAEFCTLASRLPGIAVAHCELKMALPLDEVLCRARRELRTLRFPRFDRESASDRRPETLRAVFLDDLEEAEVPVLLLLDTFEQATDEAKRWVEDHLLDRCRQHDGLRLVIAGQQVPRPRPILSGLVLCRELPPIAEPEHWCTYLHEVLKAGPVPTEQMAFLVRAAVGSPRAIADLLGNLAEARS